MDIPCRVSADLRRREEENDRAEEWFADNGKQMIEDEEYKLLSNFCLDDFLKAIEEASGKDQLALYEAFKAMDGPECWAMLSDIRDAYIRKTAEDNVENS